MKEVCIIGGGIVGLCCAYYLSEEGIPVTIIDKGDFTDGCSHGNAGMIVPSHFIPMASPGIMAKGVQWMFQKKSPFFIRPRLDMELLRWLWLFDKSVSHEHVVESAPLLRDMHQESKEFYVKLNGKPGFDFQLKEKGILMLYQNEETGIEEEETADMAYTLGIEVEKLSHNGVQQLEKSAKLDVRGAFYYPGDAHLHPGKLMQQLINDLKSRGVTFLSGHEAETIIVLDKDASQIRCKDGQIIQTGNVVVACGSWSSRLMKTTHRKMPMQDGKGYAMTFTESSFKPSIPSILIEPRVAITPMGDELRISGTLEISGMDDKVQKHKVQSILEAVPKFYPKANLRAADKTWHGYRPLTPDGLPFIGRWDDQSPIIVATGHGMMGTSLAPATGRIIRDLILNRKTATLSPKLRPSRFA